MPTLFLEAFGTLSEDTDLPIIDAQEEDLYSVFRERAELMGWLSPPTGLWPNGLWAIEEAEESIAGVGVSRIGWVQVGLERSADPAMVLPALVQCFYDSLSRFGIMDLISLQVTAHNLEPKTQDCLWHLGFVLNWFNIVPKESVEASIALDCKALSESDLVSDLQYETRAFEFRALGALHESARTRTPPEMPYYPASPQPNVGLSVKMLEWEPSAIGWVLASVVEAVRAKKPDMCDLAVLISRAR